VIVTLRGQSNPSPSTVSEAGLGVGRDLLFVAAFASAVFGGMLLWLFLRCRGMVGQECEGTDSLASAESSDELACDMLEPFADDSSDARSEDLDQEHPQTLALMLVRMPSGQAADIIARLPVKLRAEVDQRMSDLRDVDSDTVSQINRDLATRLNGKVSGPAGDGENIDHRRAERDALKLQVFEDIILLGTGELRVALGAVEPDDLAISLRMVAKQVRRKILGSLSPRDAEYVRARMDRIGPMRICDVESARHRVMETVSQAAGVPQAPQDSSRQASMEDAV
jgi:hypothetical protein